MSNMNPAAQATQQDSLIAAAALPETDASSSMQAADAPFGDDADSDDVTDVMTLQLPPVLRNPQLEGQGAGGWTLELYKQVCFNCTGLNPEGEKNHRKMKCRSELGNENCPVGQIEIHLVGTRKQLLRTVQSAQRSGNALNLIEALDHVRTHATPDQLQWVLDQAGLTWQISPALTAAPEEDETPASGINTNEGGFPVAP